MLLNIGLLFLVGIPTTFSDVYPDGKDRVICFHTPSPGERGTDVAMFDYADYTEKLFGYTAKIIIPDVEKNHHAIGLSKYVERFGVNVNFFKPDELLIYVDPREPPWKDYGAGPSFPYEAKRLGCHYVYSLKSGKRDTIPRFPEAFNHTVVRQCVHEVFDWEFHDEFTPTASISEDVINAQNHDVVPHMVRPPSPEYENMKGLRSSLNISDKSLVLCRHGGMDSFDLPFVHSAVYKLLDQYSDGQLEFVFLGTKPFGRMPGEDPNNPALVAHPRIHYLASNPSLEYKEQFIKTCDAMIHARKIGETFGLSVAEFSVHNKPVITYPGDSQKHLQILGDRAFIYHNEDEFMLHVVNFLEHGVNKSVDYNAYQDYAPEKVMAQFKKIFYDPIFGE